MDAFQREVIDRLARIETKLEDHAAHGSRITVLERGESRRNAIVAGIAALPLAGLAALWVAIRGTTS